MLFIDYINILDIEVEKLICDIFKMSFDYSVVYFKNSYVLEIYAKMFIEKMIYFMGFASKMILSRRVMSGIIGETNMAKWLIIPFLLYMFEMFLMKSKVHMYLKYICFCPPLPYS